MKNRYYLGARILALAITLLASASWTHAQQFPQGKIRAQYKRLNSLGASMAETRAKGPADGFIAIPNRPWRPIGGDQALDDEETVSKGEAVVQDFVANGALTAGVSFQALSNQDNWTPADPSADVGPNHIVLGVNSNITIFNKDGTVATGGATTSADALWNGTTCYGGSNGDPIILYDEVADRWIAAITHFSRNLLCIAASASGDPLGAWHDYVFDFGNQLPDYPKLGLSPDHLVVTAHMFGAIFSGTLFGVIDKTALYAGQPISLLYDGGYSYGYLPVDMDGSMPSRNPLFVGFANSSTAYVYEMQNINYATETANVQFVNSIGFASVDRSVCSATRGQCITQPATWKVESLDGRLMHRANLRNFGSHEAVVFSQTINIGSERAGIAWYEIRNSGGSWSKWQEGRYGPSDSRFRWMPSIALNAAGDIGMSFMRSSSTEYPSVAVVGQSGSERASATGQFDGNEMVCANGTTPLDPTGYKRSGDYSATVVDPFTDTFWAIQQYAYPGVWADWGVWICEFSVTPTVNTNPPTADFSGSPLSGIAPLNVSFTDLSTDGPTSWLWDFGDGNTSTQRNPQHTFAAGTYTVELTATNGNGFDTMTKTNYVSAEAPLPPPADPTGLVATGTSPSSIHIDWIDNAVNEDGYRLERSDNGISGWAQIASLGVDANSYDDDGLPSGVTRYYRAYAYHSQANSGYSNVDGGTTDSPSVIDHTVASQSTTSGTVSGSYSNTETNGAGVQTLTEVESGGKPSRRTSLLETVYTFEIRTDIPATFFANTWSTTSGDGDEFDFYYSENGSNYTFMFSVYGGTDDDSYRSFVLGSPSSSTIWVRVRDSNRDQGKRTLDQVFIDHMFVRTELSSDPPPDAPTLSASATGASSATLNWSDVATETGYRVQRSVDNASFSTVANLAADETTYEDTGLAGATEYFYRVGAFNAGGTTYSNADSVTTDTPDELHVGALSGSSAGGKKWTAAITVTVHDAVHGLASGATVSGAWGGGGSGGGSCVTDGSGTCDISKDFKPNTSSVSFTVQNITRAGATYNEAENHVTETTVSSAAGKGASSNAEIPGSLVLEQNYPNPFNPITVFQFGLPETGHATVAVYNALGVEVAILADGVMEAGWHRVAFDGSNLSSGIYLAVVRTGGSIRTRSMLLMK